MIIRFGRKAETGRIAGRVELGNKGGIHKNQTAVAACLGGRDSRVVFTEDGGIAAVSTGDPADAGGNAEQILGFYATCTVSVSVFVQLVYLQSHYLKNCEKIVKKVVL